jgi:hypothetical protein
MYVCTRMHYACMCVCMLVSVYVCMYDCMYACVYVRVRMYVRTNVCAPARNTHTLSVRYMQ